MAATASDQAETEAFQPPPRTVLGRIPAWIPGIGLFIGVLPTSILYYSLYTTPTNGCEFFAILAFSPFVLLGCLLCLGLVAATSLSRRKLSTTGIVLNIVSVLCVTWQIPLCAMGVLLLRG